MEKQTSHRFSYHDDENLKLGQIFIGRSEQLERFETYLARWKQIMAETLPEEKQVTSAPSLQEKIQGLVVLLYGRGGIGKSTLLERYHKIALSESQAPMRVSGIVDWEFAIEGKRGLFTFTPEQETNLSTYILSNNFAFGYLKLLCQQLAKELNKRDNDFKHYQKALASLKDAESQFTRIEESLKKDERFAPLRQAIGGGIADLLKIVPGGSVISSVVLNTDKAKDMLGESAIDVAERMVQILKKKLGHKLDEYLEPALHLGLALGQDLFDFARNLPLLIFFDTYEEIDEGDQLLRIVMGAAGVRVGWVLAGRDNLWAGLEQRTRSQKRVYGYKDMTEIGRAVDLGTGSIGSFTPGDIVEYFTQLCQMLPDLPEITEDGADRLWNVTQGVPLAVKIAAGLYQETGNLDLITEDGEKKSDIIDQMVHRYLQHTQADQAERDKLHGLALLRRADQPAAIAAVLGLTPEEAKTSYDRELNRLQRRYSFIFTEKKQPTLHQEVRYFLRQWLLERRKNPDIYAVNQRLKEAHEAALEQLERADSTLKQRLQDEEWVGVYLDLIEQQFWLDPALGIRYTIPFMIAATLYQDDIVTDVEEIGNFFEAQMKSPSHKWWKLAGESLAYYSWFELLNGLEELRKLVVHHHLTFPKLLPEYTTELESILWWKMGEACRYFDNGKALEYYEKALSRLDTQSELKKTVAEIYHEIANKLYREKKYIANISLLDRAIELDPTDVRAYDDRGVAYAWLNQYERAIQDYNKAIEMDPTYAGTYESRGVAYAWLNQYERAIQDYNTAIKLDPTDIRAHTGRGVAYAALNNYERAIQNYDKAIELNTTYARAYRDRGDAYTWLNNYERAIQDYNKAIEYYGTAIKLDPTDIRTHTGRGNAYAALNNYEQAIQDYDRAIELNPTYAGTYDERGYAHARLGKYEQAIQDYDKAIELNPTYAGAYRDRGEAYCDLQRYEQAIQDYDKAIELDPTYAGAYSGRGFTYQVLKQYIQAIHDYTQAIRAVPTYTTAYINRGIAYAFLKEEQKAITDINHAAEIAPAEIRSVWIARWAEFGKQRVGVEIGAQLENIAAMKDLDQYNACICRGVALGLQGRSKDGLVEVERAISQQPLKGNAYFWQGMLCAYYYRGNDRMAIEAIEQALEREGGLPPLLLKPLYWLEQDRRQFFEEHIKPLLKKYGCEDAI